MDKAPATVLSSSVKELRDEEEPFLADVRYRYQLEGRSFTSNDYQKSTPSYADYREAQAMAFSGLASRSALMSLPR
jgi:hypothetical protein